MPPEKIDFGHLEINGSVFELAEGLQGRDFPTFIDPEYVSDWEVMKITQVLSTDAEATFEGDCLINPNAMRKLLGMEPVKYSFPCEIIADEPVSMSFTCNSPVKIPIRKHRKKRIAKKWAKKYGYRYEFREVQLKDVSIIQDDNRIDLLGRTERRIVR